MCMDQKLLVGVAVGLVVGAIGGYLIGGSQPAPASEGVASEEGGAVNPFENVTANPLENVRTNPLQNVKLNPFE
ncbi:hypothetical protein A2673_02825 [Candidatus Kaiserbacteria bacterium RIFCSPHIGHO2_01_FULL_50_13]|nr:MAG: hypothetical protein A2673_02825 [Candidatus Kaiserbacteria bacterium RIFCSPHIGHO2_01_FULL_50_13]